MPASISDRRGSGPFAHRGDGRAHQPRDFRVGGPLAAALQLLGTQPAVLVDRRPLQRILVDETHLGAIDGDREKRLVLDEIHPRPREFDRGGLDRLAEPRGVDRDARLLAQFPGARLGQRLPVLGSAADREPERVIRPPRIPAVQQQHAPFLVDGKDACRVAPEPHSTIFEIGISRMSMAPAALSAGISVLTPRLGTTVSIAFMSPDASAVTVGEDIAGSIRDTASSLAAGTLSFSSTLPRAWMAPRSSSAMSSIADRFSVSAYDGGQATSSV